jgi:hypothetical protein
MQNVCRRPSDRLLGILARLLLEPKFPHTNLSIPSHLPVTGFSSPGFLAGRTSRHGKHGRWDGACTLSKRSFESLSAQRGELSVCHPAISSTTPSPAATRDLTRLAGVAFPLTEKGRHPVACFRSPMIPPVSPLSTLRCHPSRDHRQDSRPEWSRFSFSVGLSRPLQCAGLSRRSLSPGFQDWNGRGGPSESRCGTSLDA